MMDKITPEYLAAGANRHPSAADWDESGLLAYGTDRNIALWYPGNETSRGVFELLSGHTDTVNVVKFIPKSHGLILSGSVDKAVRIWKRDEVSKTYTCIQTITDHQSTINCIAVTEGSKIFATGSADAIVNVWKLDDSNVASLQQSITITPRLFPLALALSPLTGASDSLVLAVAGTKDIIQLHVLDAQAGSEFKYKATLSGHEGWIRSLEFTKESDSPTSDLLLSSASQDKYIRLWRIHQGKELPAAATAADPTFGAFMPGKSLSNKAHRFQAQELDFSATFEALLLGHEDWIYSTRWLSPSLTSNQKPQLLSASADNSLAIWEPDTHTGVWVTIARLGEISAEKGSTTATGSTGGFWTGLWSPTGSTVVSLGRTGSWRLWNHDTSSDRWAQNTAITGHVKPVMGIAWSKDGSYLLSTSTDQTTRLHAQWKRDAVSSWHEMARPQIHGYDLNCIDSLGASQFVSGADEKLLRVFNEPRAVATLLHKLCGIGNENPTNMPDAANMPVLGLSNKAIEATPDDDQTISRPDDRDRDAIDPASIVHKSTLDLSSPPLEDHLSRHTLWPETEKLYGHGYEISALATSHDGSIIATACKASSIDHAVIRLFETKEWHELKPSLTAHSLTVARLRFSSDDKYLLSVGRDRQWAIFKRDDSDRNTYALAESNPKGHTRMILDAAWAPSPSSTAPPVFATAGRDKSVKIWGRDAEGGFVCKATIASEAPVTAIDFYDEVVGESTVYLAVGTEVGRFKIYRVEIGDEITVAELPLEISNNYYPSKAITQLAWKPSSKETSENTTGMELAIASEDSSLRIYSLC
ncbi:putative rna polymerase ii elongator protein [Botrytis fragariae]|uniref:Elongator complex protein 2 n=1 Tax=Botrytis fragariae TaxID=1964551 RepID=A0A8H6EGJ2_9HELO|nr:putative rna polymerase ii elongator protein [Botrytis fragariae]KAF5871383.1 putative rna polymerase ii elongator protein [Botrytis fragariae]